MQATTTVSAILTIYDRGNVTLSGNINVQNTVLTQNHMLGKQELSELNLLMKQTVLDTDYDFVNGGKSDYFILLPSNPTENESFAASELQLFTKKATGAELKIIKEGTVNLRNKFISIGNANASGAVRLPVTYAKLKNNGFVIETIDNNCYIRGYSDIGTRNGVYEFLYYLFDYECYAADEIYLTETKSAKLPDFKLSVTPDFDWREANYGEIIYNTDLCYRMRFNPTEEIYVMGHKTHNSIVIINPLVYDFTSEQYKSWFSRVKHKYANFPKITAVTQHEYESFPNVTAPAQLCYSNEEMAKQYIKNLIERIKTSSAKVMLMGMEDNKKWCTCEKCSASKAKYGTNSAVVIKFANKVQQGVNEWFRENRPGEEPTKMVIFAYYETINPPVTYNSASRKYVPIDDMVVLNNDVGIMFAPIEASYSVPFVDPKNAMTRVQIEGWSSITKNLYAWTYSLFPSKAFVLLDTIGIMQQNYSFLIENNAKGILDQTEHYQKYINSGWSRVKAYIMSKLQWDNTLDLDVLIENYFKIYFDKSSGVMKELFTAEREWLSQHVYKKLGAKGYIWENLIKRKYWAYSRLKNYLNKIDQAYASISGYQSSDPEKYTKLYDRITIESIQFRYLMIQIYSANFSASELLNMKNSFKADFERLKFTTHAEGADISALWSSWGI